MVVNVRQYCTKTNKRQISVEEMIMLRWVSEQSRKYKIRNCNIASKLEKCPLSIEENMSQPRLRWFGHVRRGLIKL